MDSWASKTHVPDKAEKHKRLIATHISLPGIRWWGHYEEFHKRLDAISDEAPNRGFLFPYPNKEMTG